MKKVIFLIAIIFLIAGIQSAQADLIADKRSDLKELVIVKKGNKLEVYQKFDTTPAGSFKYDRYTEIKTYEFNVTDLYDSDTLENLGMPIMAITELTDRNALFSLKAFNLSLKNEALRDSLDRAEFSIILGIHERLHQEAYIINLYYIIIGLGALVIIIIIAIMCNKGFIDRLEDNWSSRDYRKSTYGIVMSFVIVFLSIFILMGTILTLATDNIILTSLSDPVLIIIGIISFIMTVIYLVQAQKKIEKRKLFSLPPRELINHPDIKFEGDEDDRPSGEFKKGAKEIFPDDGDPGGD